MPVDALFGELRLAERRLIAAEERVAYCRAAAAKTSVVLGSQCVSRTRDVASHENAVIRLMAANSRRGYWFTVNTGAVTRGITNERLIRAGFFELSPAYESIQTACIGRAVYRTVRTVR